MHLLLFFFF